MGSKNSDVCSIEVKQKRIVDRNEKTTRASLFFQPWELDETFPLGSKKKENYPFTDNHKFRPQLIDIFFLIE